MISCTAKYMEYQKEALGQVARKRPRDVKRGKPDKKSKSNKKKNQRRKMDSKSKLANPLLSMFPGNSYVISNQPVLPPIGYGNNDTWRGSPRNTPGGYLPNIDAYQCNRNEIVTRTPREQSRTTEMHYNNNTQKMSTAKIEADIVMLEKAIARINKCNEQYGHMFIPFDSPVLNGPGNPALQALETNSWRVVKFREQFNRQTKLLPGLCNGKTSPENLQPEEEHILMHLHDKDPEEKGHNELKLLERCPGVMKLASQHFAVEMGEVNKMEGNESVAILPHAPTEKVPVFRRRFVKVKMPSAEEQENVRRMIQNGNIVPNAPQTEKPLRRPRRSRRIIQDAPRHVITEEIACDDDANGFLKYF